MIATVDCGRCITIGDAVGHRRIGIQCAGVHDWVDLVERTAACSVCRAIDVVPQMLDELLGFQDRFTECVPAAVPFPESAWVMVDGCALLVKVSEALALPAT